MWVVFDDDFEIRLFSGLRIAPNTTIDGRGRLITIHGVLRIPDRNVIVTNVIIENITGPSSLDGIAIHGDNPTDIWIDHVSFEVTPDELLILWHNTHNDRAPGNVTVTWSRFGRGGLSPSSEQDASHGILIGAQSSNGKDAARTRLTLAYNMFETGQRAPLVGDGARVHAFNNLYDDWGFFAIQARRNGRVRSEANIFAERSDGSGTRVFWVNEGALMGGEVLYDANSWFPYGASATELNRESVFGLPYWYGPVSADANLMTDIRAGAGATLR